MKVGHFPLKLQDKEPYKNEAILEAFWPVESRWRPHCKATNELCGNCASIDFRFFVKNRISVRFPDHKYMLQEIPLGWLSGTRNRQNCTFCRLVKNVMSIYWKDKQTDEVWKSGRINGESVDCSLSNHSEQVDYMLPDVFIDEGPEGTVCWELKVRESGDFYNPLDQPSQETIDMARSRVYYFEVGTNPSFHQLADRSSDAEVSPSFPSRVPSKRLFQLPKIQAILNSEASASQRLSLGGRVVPIQADATLLRNWVLMCEKSCHQVLKSGSISELRVVDVVSGCVTLLKPPGRYVALSYVWGKSQPLVLTTSNRALLESIGSLKSATVTPSKTIQDAISLTRKLSERYLWIDALCILQDDDYDKSIWIPRMDQIYSSACCTIVAASGKNSGAGLPGVNPGSRNPNQLIEEVRGMKLGRMLPGRADTIDNTIWNSRAWTFQERLLSNRMMIFTAEQIQFHCQGGCNFWEDVVTESECALFNDTFLRKPLSVPLRRPLLDYQEEINFDVYARLISEYTARHMTDPRDCLIAFGAIEQMLKPLFKIEHGFLAGLPQTAFDAALLWKPVGPSKRRTDPKTGALIGWSWAWAGWEGEVSYEPTINIAETTASMLSWASSRDISIETSVPLDWSASKMAQNQWQTCFDEESEAIYYKDNYKDHDIRFCRPILNDEPLNPTLKYLNTFRDKCLTGDTIKGLEFWAPSATFIIDGSHIPLSFAEPKCAEGTHILCPLSILDDQSHVAGTVLVDGSTATCLQPDRYEFIALSQRTVNRNSTDVSWDPTSLTFLRRPEDRQHPISNSESEESDDEPLNPEVVDAETYALRRRFRDGFDSRIYDKDRYWCLYNVLLIQWCGDVAQRVGIGKVHVEAFDQVAKRKRIILA